MLQERIDKIAQWANDWKMEINPGKSKIMHMGKNNPGERKGDQGSCDGEGHRILDNR